VRLAAGLAYEELILRGAAGVRPGIDDELSVGAQQALAARDRVLDQRGG
jgi:hypothetical protein